MMRKILFLLMFVLLAQFALAQEECISRFDMVVFYGDGCPHCADLHEHMTNIQEDHPGLNVQYYEIWYNKTNSKLFSNLAEKYGIKARGVPTAFINDKVYVGYSDSIEAKIDASIDYCHNNTCIDPMTRLQDTGDFNFDDQDLTVYIPFIGHVDSNKMSLPVFTVIIGLIDGFNPCAFFVLLFLLSMLISLRSRKRMLIVGGTFAFFSGLIYFVFMAAWLNFFLITGQVAVITTIAGIVAVLIAIINIKDFFFFKKGVSLTIADSHKPKLFERMRNLLKASSWTSMLIGAVVLAIAANMYELLCTAGFPMVFTRILTLNEIPTFLYYLYLILYNISYIIPLGVIVLFMTATFGAKKMTEWQGEMLKLLSGIMMLTLGIILLINPAMLNNLPTTVGILLLAVVITGLIILISLIIRKKMPGGKDSE